MIAKVANIKSEVEAYVFDENQKAETFRLLYLSKKGIITELFEEFKKAPVEEKRTLGGVLNGLKQLAEAKYQEQKEKESENSEGDLVAHDITLPVYQTNEGALHPLRIVEDRLLEIFYSLGFDLSEGPEIEDDYHNFGALNFAEDHPARDMQDTFLSLNMC